MVADFEPLGNESSVETGGVKDASSSSQLEMKEQTVLPA